MRVKIPSPLLSYTGGVVELEGQGSSLQELLSWLDSQYPGMRFRIVDEQDCIRPHIRFFVGSTMAREISHTLGPADVVKIVCALSGG